MILGNIKESLQDISQSKQYQKVYSFKDKYFLFWVRILIDIFISLFLYRSNAETFNDERKS